MKKNKILIILFSLFISLFSISSINAEETKYTYKTTIPSCSLSTGKLKSDWGFYSVYVYEITGNSPVNLDFIFENGNKLYTKVSSTYSETCDNTLKMSNWGSLSVDTPQIRGTYSLSNSVDTPPYYFYVWGGYYEDNGERKPGYISWGTGTEPEPEPEPLEFNNKIYIPESDVYNKCYVVQNEDVIRAYDVIPASGIYYNYRDYYINSDYIYKDGSGVWSNYSTLPVCLSEDIITNDFYYRTDFYKILIMFLIISIFGIYLPLKIFSKLFRKGGL